MRETRKVPVIEEDRGELQQLVNALEEGHPVPPPPAKATRTVTVTRDVAVAPRRRDDSPHATRPGRGCGRVVLAVASVAAVIVGIVYFPLQTIATCAVLAVLSGGYWVVIVRR